MLNRPGDGSIERVEGPQPGSAAAVVAAVCVDVEHPAAHRGGLEVEAPTQAANRGLGRPWEAVKRRVSGARDGSAASRETSTAVSASAVVAEPPLRVDVVSPDPAIDARLDEDAPGTADQDGTRER